MKLARDVRSISYLKAHAAELVREVTERRGAVLITQHGEGKVVLQDARAYDELQESLALLRILAQSRSDARDGRVAPLAEVAARLRAQDSNSSEP